MRVPEEQRANCAWKEGKTAKGHGLDLPAIRGWTAILHHAAVWAKLPGAAGPRHCAGMLNFLQIFQFPAPSPEGRLPARAWVIAIAVVVLQATAVAWGLAVLR